MASPTSSGSRAQSSGKTAELIISRYLLGKGFTVGTQIPIGTSIYGTQLNADVYVSDFPGYPKGLAIESKWQDAAGSVDEKFPYLIWNIKEKYQTPAVVVMDGHGIRPGAVDWAKNQVDGQRLVAVFSMQQFKDWVDEMGDPAPGGIYQPSLFSGNW